MFLNRTLGTEALASLVYEGGGRILGFLGVMPRRMRFHGVPVLMAVCSQFVVDPAGRGQVGLRLLKHCFDGPQALTVTDEAGDSTRTIWEWCGGETVLSYSMRWIRPLRPAQLGLSVLAERPSLALLASATPIARIVDAVVERLGPAGFRVSPPRGSRAELDESTLLACLSDVAGDRSFGPDYDPHSVAWAIDRASRRSGHDRARKLVVRNEESGIDGWFVYCQNGDGIAEVLQVATRPRATGQVLTHLFDDAVEHGAIAVAGRLEPGLVAALSEMRAFFYRGDAWTLMHSTNDQLRHAVHRGDAFLTRLEGEWCLRFP